MTLSAFASHARTLCCLRAPTPIAMATIVAARRIRQDQPGVAVVIRVIDRLNPL